VCRSEKPLSDGLKRKISNMCDVDVRAVINAADARNIYELPLILHEEGLDGFVCDLLRIEGDVDLTSWESLVAQVDASVAPVKIGLIGKYVELQDAYLSVVESLKHAGFHHSAKVEIDWIQAEDVEGLLASPADSGHAGSRGRSPRRRTRGRTGSRVSVCASACR
jgi:CTP synthase